MEDNDNWQVKTLDSQAAFLERNILGVPICVLHPKAAHLFDYLEHSWTTKEGADMRFRLYRSGDSKVGLPTTEHARWLHIMLAMFAANWNEKGYLNFTFAQMLRIADMKNDSTARDTIYEAIKRYRKCQAEWDQSWDGRMRSWNYAFIVESDLFDEHGNLKKNPRKAKTPDEWQKIRFCEPIVESLKNESTRRLISTSIFKSEISSSAYMIYTYFYSFSDLTPVERSFEHLLRVFPWKSRLSKFIEWLNQNLNECQKHGYIEFYNIKKSSVVVKSKNIKQLKTTLIELEKPTPAEERHRLTLNKKGDKLTTRKPKGATTKKLTPAQNIDITTLTVEYLARRESGMMSEDARETIDPFIELLSSGISDKQRKAIIPGLITALHKALAEPAAQGKKRPRKKLLPSQTLDIG